MLKYIIASLVCMILVVICIACQNWKKSIKYTLLAIAGLILVLMLVYSIKFIADTYFHSYPSVVPIAEHNDRIEPPRQQVDTSKTYLDDKRDLKEVYTVSEINNETSAFCTGYSTLLYSPMKGFSPYFRQDINSCMDVEYSLIIAKGVTDNTLNMFTLQEETRYQTLDEYYKNIQEFAEDMRTEYGQEPNALEKTDDYVFYSREYDGYQYKLTKEIGDRLYTIYADTEYLQGWDKKAAPGREVTESFRKDALYIFDHLLKDDGKTAYVYDKLVNLKLPEDYRIRSYTDIDVYHGTTIGLNASAEKNIRISFYKKTKTDFPSGWVRKDNIIIDTSRGAFTEVYYEEDDWSYEFHFGNKHDFENLDECMSYLAGTGILVKK